MFDAVGLEVLSEAECYRLLGSASVGRIVFTEQALPAIQPVSYGLRGQSLVMRTTVGSKLAVATRNSVVAFEVDHFDHDHVRAGWSVVAVGHASEITDPAEVALVRTMELRPWALDMSEHYIRIDIELISGRRVQMDTATAAVANREHSLD
jgi:nitroimidazol reductase NimA-like FMN-containing flavoprotein (pyridoxamine 5'-phosphate oxidase superfamily)